MSKLPVVSGRDCVKALQLAGFLVKRQESSHIVLRRDSPFAQVVDRGTLRAIIRQAGLTVEQFTALLG
jgi:predicted RNA binding protein YcfA (HicA-like mRNA interferase family)